MWFKHRAWIPVAWFLSLANVVSVWFAAQPGEPWHATTHAVLAAGFALGGRHLMARRRTKALSEDLQDALEQNDDLHHTLEDMQPRMHELEERVDFAERLLAQQRAPDRQDAPPR